MLSEPDGSLAALLPAFCIRFKQHLGANRLRTLCNQWCSHRPFQNSRGCVFGCAFLDDSVEHSIIREKLRNKYHDIFGFSGLRFSGKKIVSLGVDGTLELADGKDFYGQPNIDSDYILIYNQACFLCYNACSHGESLSRRLLTRQFKSTAEHCARSRSLIHWWRQIFVH